MGLGVVFCVIFGIASKRATAGVPGGLQNAVEMVVDFIDDTVSSIFQQKNDLIAMLSATGTLGELGILPGHAPLLTGIRPGPVRLRDEHGKEDVFYASGGYLEIQPGVVTVLADTALRADDIDEAAAIEARQEAQRPLSEAVEMDYGRVEAQLAAAAAQQRTLEELRKLRR